MATGIVLAGQATNPIPNGSSGVWMNTSGQLVTVNTSGTPQNISIGAAGTGIYISILNNSGSTITKGSVVSINTSGELALVDVSVPTNASRVVGIVNANILNGAAGLVCTAGVVENLSTSLVFGDQVYAAASSNGALYGVEPSIGVGSFVGGDYVIRIGILTKNTTNLSQKDLIVNITIVGTL